jgi:hypothetical protein
VAAAADGNHYLGNIREVVPHGGRPAAQAAAEAGGAPRKQQVQNGAAGGAEAGSDGAVAQAALAVGEGCGAQVLTAARERAPLDEARQAQAATDVGYLRKGHVEPGADG